MDLLPGKSLKLGETSDQKILFLLIHHTLPFPSASPTLPIPFFCHTHVLFSLFWPKSFKFLIFFHLNSSQFLDFCGLAVHGWEYSKSWFVFENDVFYFIATFIHLMLDCVHLNIIKSVLLQISLIYMLCIWFPWLLYFYLCEMPICCFNLFISFPFPFFGGFWGRGGCIGFCGKLIVKMCILLLH